MDFKSYYLKSNINKYWNTDIVSIIYNEIILT